MSKSGGVSGAGGGGSTSGSTGVNGDGNTVGGGGFDAEKVLAAQQASINRAIDISLKASIAKTLGDALIGAANKA